MSADVMQFAAPVESAAVVLEPGMHFDVSERVYHGDPCPTPSLSASSGKVLLNRSPRAFQWKHPRLRPAHLPPVEESYSDQAVFGTVVHKLVLGRGKDVVEVDADAWRSQAAKQERADITAAGKVAILKHRLADAKIIAGELAHRVRYTPSTPTEVVLIWQDEASDGTKVWCRAMIDALPEPNLIEDLKVTGAELTDAFVSRQVGSMFYDFSMAWYRRGLSIIRPDLAGRIRTRLTFGERKEPYDVFPLDLTEGNLHVADRQVQVAIDRFALCMTAGNWPGVAPHPRTLDLPDWHQRAFLNAELDGEYLMADDTTLDASSDVLTATAQGRLRSIIERLERLDEDKQAVMTNMKEVFAEAKGEGYDVKVLRKVLSLRKQDKAKRQEEESILDLYLSALGEI